MNKLEIIQKRIKELKLYKEYLLRFKLFNSLNSIPNDDVNKKRYKSK